MLNIDHLCECIRALWAKSDPYHPVPCKKSITTILDRYGRTFAGLQEDSPTCFNEI